MSNTRTVVEYFNDQGSPALISFGRGSPQADSTPLAWTVNDLAFDTLASGNVAIYKCTASGTPGTWKTLYGSPVPIGTLTGPAVVYTDSTGTLTVDVNNLVWDPTNHRLVVGKAGAYTPAAGAPLTISSADASNNAALYDRAATQRIVKSGGLFQLGTIDTNSTELIANGSTGLSLASGGGVTLASLAGTGTELVKTSSTGLLSRAAVGTDYQAALNLTSGSVLFSGGGAVVSQDNANFFWNNSTKTLEVGLNNTTITEAVSHFYRNSSGATTHLVTNDNTAGLAGFRATLSKTSVANDYLGFFMFGNAFGASGLLGPRVALLEAAPAATANFVVSNLSSGSLVFATGGSRTNRGSFDGSGNFTVVSLAGTGTELVKTSSAGVLSRAAVGTDYQAALNLTAGSVLFSGGGAVVSQDNSNFFFDGTNHRLILKNGGAFTPAAGAPLTIAGSDASNLAITLTQAATQRIAKTGGAGSVGTEDANTFAIRTNATDRISVASGGTITASPLAGTGTRMVTADPSGVLSTQTLPSGATPGGSNRQVQYNNSGAFGGATGFEYDSATSTTRTPSILDLSVDLRSATATLSMGGTRVDNYTANTPVVLVSAGADGTTLTGIVAPTATYAGDTSKILWLLNDHSNTLVLGDENTNSTAANRFRFSNSGSANLILGPGDAVQVAYDSNAARWRALKVVNDRTVYRSLTFSMRGSFGCTGPTGGLWLPVSGGDELDSRPALALSVNPIEYPIPFTGRFLVTQAIIDCAVSVTQNTCTGTVVPNLTLEGSVVGAITTYTAGATGNPRVNSFKVDSTTTPDLDVNTNTWGIKLTGTTLGAGTLWMFVSVDFELRGFSL